MNFPAYDTINQILHAFQVVPEIIEHPAVLTCEDADRYTPQPQNGIKSILLKWKHDYLVIVIPGDKRASIEKIKSISQQKRISFAKMEDALIITGAQKGALPPFGHVQQIPILIDETIQRFTSIYFNPGINTQTYGLKNADFIKIFEHVAEFTDIIEK